VTRRAAAFDAVLAPTVAGYPAFIAMPAVLVCEAASPDA
jgi:hypothetical protein